MRLVRRLIAQHAVVTEDGVKGRAQLVRDDGEEFVLAAVRRFGLRAGSLSLGAGLRFLEQQDFSFDLDALAFSDVAGDFRCADYFSRLISNRRDSQRNVNLMSIFAAAHGFVMVNLLAAPDTFEDLWLFVSSVRRNDNHQ